MSINSLERAKIYLKLFAVYKTIQIINVQAQIAQNV